ncbi:MAG: hypothetical protein AAB817_02965, partial [Patescibacteria group bacterium]
FAYDLEKVVMGASVVVAVVIAFTVVVETRTAWMDNAAFRFIGAWLDAKHTALCPPVHFAGPSPLRKATSA